MYIYIYKMACENLLYLSFLFSLFLIIPEYYDEMKRMKDGDGFEEQHAEPLCRDAGLPQTLNHHEPRCNLLHSEIFDRVTFCLYDFILSNEHTPDTGQSFSELAHQHATT